MNKNNRRALYILIFFTFLAAVIIIDLGVIPMISSSIINVKDYGAVGDGTSNDSQAVKKAFDAAMDENKTLYFPAGKYNLQNMNFNTKNDLTMLGESSSSTQLIEPGNFFCSGNVTVRHMSVLNTTGEFLYLLPAKPIILDIDSVIYTSPIEYGNNTRFVYCYTESTTGYISRVKITNCDISNCRYGIMLGCKIDSGLISSNSIYQLGNSKSPLSVAGILLGYPNSHLVYASNMTVTNNKIHDLVTSYSNTSEAIECQGIILYGNGGSVIQNNYLHNIAGGYDHEGIYCKSVDVKILNNTLINTGDGDGAIVVKTNSPNNDIFISGNTINNSIKSTKEMYGILVTGQRFTVNSNNIKMNSGIAIYAAVGNNGILDGVITNNIIQTYGRTSIYLTRTLGSVTISGNTMTQKSQSGEKQDAAINLSGTASSAVINITQNTISISRTKLFNMWNASTSAKYNIKGNTFSTDNIFANSLFGLKGKVLQKTKADNTILSNMSIPSS